MFYNVVVVWGCKMQVGLEEDVHQVCRTGNGLAELILLSVVGNRSVTRLLLPPFVFSLTA